MTNITWTPHCWVHRCRSRSVTPSLPYGDTIWVPHSHGLPCHTTSTATIYLEICKRIFITARGALPTRIIGQRWMYRYNSAPPSQDGAWRWYYTCGGYHPWFRRRSSRSSSYNTDAAECATSPLCENKIGEKISDGIGAKESGGELRLDSNSTQAQCFSSKRPSLRWLSSSSTASRWRNWIQKITPATNASTAIEP